MKKQYINPATIIVKVKVQGHLMFGSPNDANSINGGGNKGNYSGNQLSREANSDWEDDEY